MKTPVKSTINYNSAPALKNLLPENRQTVSMLLFSGQLECELSFQGVDIVMATNRHSIYEFWKCMIEDPYNIASTSDSLHEQMDPELVYVFQNDWTRFKDPFFRSSLFFLLNKYSRDGTISHGNFNINNYSPVNGQSLINFFEYNDRDKIKLKYYKAEKFYEGFEGIKSDQVLLIPAGKYSPSPLANPTFVGHDKYHFSDSLLRKTINNYKKDFVIVYKFNPRLLIDYKRYNTIMVNNLGEITKNKSSADEIIITNLEVR